MRTLVFILLFFISSFLYAQKQNGTIYFKDGTIKTGLIRIKDNHKIKYKTNKDSDETTIYNSTSVEKVQIEGYEMRYYKDTKAKFMTSVRLLYRISEGKVSLYKDIVAGQPNELGLAQGSARVYFVDKDNEELIQIMPGKSFGKSSDRVIREYFEDCPKLVALLKREAFRKFVKMKEGLRSELRLEEIVKYYNTKCD